MPPADDKILTYGPQQQECGEVEEEAERGWVCGKEGTNWMESGRGWRKNQEMGRKYSPGLNIWREIKSRRISYNATVTTTKREGKERKKKHRNDYVERPSWIPYSWVTVLLKVLLYQSKGSCFLPLYPINSVFFYCLRCSIWDSRWPT